MNIRPKTVRRLTVLFAALAIFSGGIAFLLVRSVRKEKATVALMRDTAFRDYARHNYPAAVKVFGTYLNAGPAESSDAEAVFAYGMARSQVPMEGNRHIAEAINLLQKYLDLSPADAHDASHQLLMLYSRARYNKEARTLAAKLLASNPRDVEALRAEAAAMINDRDYAAAFAACRTLNQLDPNNIVWQDRELQLMAQLHQPNERIVAHASDLAKAHPDDPRFQVVMAIAYDLSGDHARAGQSIESAANLPPPDPLTALRIIAMLGRGPRPDLADDLLARAAAKFKDPSLAELSIRRMFERGQYAELATRLKTLDPKSSTPSANVLAYDSVAQYRTGHRAEADAIVVALSHRNDPVSAAWAKALRTRFAEPPIDPAGAIKAYGEAMAQDRANAVIPCYLGDAHAELGETDEAIRDWNAAARLSLLWAEPVDRICRSLASVGRYSEALAAANELIRRAPGALETQVAHAIAVYGKIQSIPAELRGEEGATLLANLEQIRARSPQDPDTLPAYASLLSRRQEPAKAIAVVRSALHSQTPLPEATFEQLLPISFEEHWGIDSEVLDAAEKAHGLTPSIAYDRAITLFRAGKQDESLRLGDHYHADHPKDAAWQLDDTRFRDAVGQPEPLKRWESLSEAYPSDIRVQYAALFAPCRFSDRDFWQQMIERVKALTGPNGQAWQIEQARFTLSGNPSPQQLGVAIESLQKLSAAAPELGEIHHLLAQALLLENRPEESARAVAEMKTAHNEQPNNFQITSELAALLISRGQRDEAAALVDAVAGNQDIDEPRRLWAAQTDGELGNFDAAIKLLTVPGAGADPRRNSLLAGLYVRAGRLDEAQALYNQISNDSSATAAELLAAGDFFARARQPDAAERCVARLKEMKLTPASADLLESQLKEQEGRPEAAGKILADACRSARQDAQLWAAWSGLTLRSGKLEDADKIAAAGLGAFPGDPVLVAMRARITQLRSVDGNDAAVLLEPVSRDPREPALGQTLDVLADAKARGQSPQQTATALRPLADRFPRFFPIQQILIGRCIAAHDLKEAADIGSRSADMLPGNPDPLKLLSGIQTARGNWDAARGTALRWRQCSLVDPFEADLEIAQIDLQKPNADAVSALKQLEPYMQPTAPEAERSAALPLDCRALLTLGRVDDAAQQLQPLVAKSPRWAGVWMDSAASAKDADTASRWLEKLTPMVPAGSQAELIGLAAAWERVGSRFDSPAAHNAARDILRPIVSEANVPAAAWRVWALANQLAGDLPQAQRAWEKLLGQEPKDPNNRNNLAFVLLLEGGGDNIARAESLAREAIAADPNVGTFYDTLARIEARLGKESEAIKNFRIALEKDPNDVEAMIGLADELQSQPSGRDEARTLLSRINAKVDSGVPLIQPIRKQLEHVKTALSASIAPGE